MKISLKLISIFLIFMIILPALLSKSVLAIPSTEPKEATCDSVREWELTWRPKIIYCKNPLKYENDTLNMHQNRYFVYVSKPDNYGSVLLKLDGLSGNAAFNDLTGNTMHWYNSSHISIDRTGAFYFPLPLSQSPNLALSSIDLNVISIGIENCTEQAIMSTILFEEGRSNVLKSRESIKNFLIFGGFAVGMVFSQAEPFPIKATDSDFTRYASDLNFLKNFKVGPNPEDPTIELWSFYGAASGVKGAYFDSFMDQATRTNFINFLGTKYPELHYETLEHPGLGNIIYDIVVSRDSIIAQRVRSNLVKLFDPSTSIQDQLILEELNGNDFFTNSMSEYFINHETIVNGKLHFDQNYDWQYVLYKAVNSGQTDFDGNLLFLEAHFDINDPSARQFAQSIAYMLYKIDPTGQLIQDISSKEITITINSLAISGHPDINQAGLDRLKNMFLTMRKRILFQTWNLLMKIFPKFLL